MTDTVYGTARYKGIAFEVLTGRQSMGQRVVTHLYPYWDNHFNDKLGRKPMRWRIPGRFHGQNFRDQAAQAMRLWNNDEAGDLYEPTLNQTYRAELAEDFVFTLDHRALDRIEFTLDLIEEGGNPYPASGGRSLLRGAVDDALVAARTAYRDNFGSPPDALAGMTAAEEAAMIWTRIFDALAAPDFTP